MWGEKKERERGGEERCEAVFSERPQERPQLRAGLQGEERNGSYLVSSLISHFLVFKTHQLGN